MQLGRETRDTVWLILRIEAQRLFAEARHLTIVLVVMAGLPLALAYQVPSPLGPAAVVGLILAERSIMDMFDQKGREFVKFAVHPLSWEVIVLGKQVAAILIALGGAGVATLVYSWFHPSPPSWLAALRGLIAYLCLLLPVVQAGGLASVTEMQKPFHTPFDMALRAGMCLIVAAFSSLPVLLLLLSDSLLPLLIYLGLLFALWYGFGIRITAAKIRQWQASLDYNA